MIASLFEEKPRKVNRITTSRELAVVLAQSSDGARADVSPPTALVSQEVDAPRRILLLLLSLVVVMLTLRRRASW